MKKNTATILAIILFGILLFFNFYTHYSVLEKKNGLIWDEAIYLNLSESLLKENTYSDGQFEISYRAPLLPYLLSIQKIVFPSGLSFFIAFLSTITLFVIFAFTKSYFGTIVGIITTIFVMVNPLFHFFSPKILTDVFLLFFMAGSFGLYLKYRKKENFLKLIFLGFLVGCAFLLKFSGILVFIVLLLFELFERKEKILAIKRFGFVFLIGFFSSLPLFFYSLNNYNSFFGIFLKQMSEVSEKVPITFYFQYMPYVLLPTTIVLLVGSLKAKDTWKRTKRVFLFSLFIILIIIHSFGYKELRYAIPLIFPALVLAGIGTKYLVSLFKKVFKSEKIKNAGYFLIIFLVVFTSFFGQSILEKNMEKKLGLYAFESVYQSGLYLKQRTNENEIIMAHTIPTIAFETKRKVIRVPKSIESLKKEISENNIRFIQLRIDSDLLAFLEDEHKLPANSLEYIFWSNKFKIIQRYSEKEFSSLVVEKIK